MGNSTKGACSTCQVEGKLQKCQLCEVSACSKCLDNPVLQAQQKDTFIATCKKCFIQNTKINFTRTFDIYGDENQKEIIFIHGGGGCRKMFAWHARSLSKDGYRCILIDLPGHGSRMDEELTHDSCIEVVKESVQKLCKTDNITLVGGSFGAYLIMETLGKYKNLCKKAIVMMAGQNIGVNRGMKASLGMWVMNKSVGLFSNVSLCNKIFSIVKGNKNLDPTLITELMEGGNYFLQGNNQMKFLSECNSAESLSNCHKQISFLFINGSKDHADSQDLWLGLAGQTSKLLVYEGGDHFFSHDIRFMERLLQDMKDFIELKQN